MELQAQDQSRRRTLRGPARWLQKALGVAVPLSGVAFILDLPYHLTDASLFPQQFLGLFLGLVLFYTFISVPLRPIPKGTQQRIPWYDWLLAIVALCGGLYVAIFYEQLLIYLGVLSPFKVCLGALFILSILEAIRRVIGWPLVAIVTSFVLYGRFGYLFPGFLVTREITWPRLVNQLYLDSEFLFGTPLRVAGLIVLSFILFGQFLFSTGGSNFLTTLAQALMGKYRGGPAKISIISSALFGTLSGTAVGNVAAVGIVTIPLMKRTGYPAHFAAAVEAVASTGGCILPPIMGAAAFIMAELLGVPYSQVILVAIVPAVLYFLGLYMQVDLRAAKEGLRGIDPDKVPSVVKTLLEGWTHIIPMVVLIYALFAWHLRAEVAAMYSLGSLLLLALISRSTRRSLKNVPGILEAVTQGMMEVSVICAGAGLVVGVVNYTGLAQSLSRILSNLAGGDFLLLAILTAGASTILGMGMPVTASYLFLAVLVAPVMEQLGVPAILAHLFVFYFGTYSFLTPPICLAVYTAASIAQAPMLKTAYQAMKLAAAGYIVPFIFIYKPAMVLMGDPLQIALAIIDGLLAVVALAIAAEGYFRRPLNWLERFVYTVACLAFFLPGWSSRLVGLGLLLSLLIYNFYKQPLTMEKSLTSETHN